MNFKKLVTSFPSMTVIMIFMLFSALASSFLAGYSLHLRQQIIETIQNSEPKNITGAIIRTNFGDIEIAFDQKDTQAKQNFIKLVRQHFYDGLQIHRVVKNFAIQMGDPLTRDKKSAGTWGTGGPGFSIAKQVNDSDSMEEGVVVMANDGINSHGSQFLILVADTPWLKGQNTRFAKVTKGIEIAKTISYLDSGVTGIPAQEVRLIDIKLK